MPPLGAWRPVVSLLLPARRARSFCDPPVGRRPQNVRGSSRTRGRSLPPNRTDVGAATEKWRRKRTIDAGRRASRRMIFAGRGSVGFRTSHPTTGNGLVAMGAAASLHLSLPLRGASPSATRPAVRPRTSPGGTAFRIMHRRV